MSTKSKPRGQKFRPAPVTGRAATLVTQKCVELLGPKGYSCEWLVEKWMRDCKINDIFEGAGQIQMLIIARSILGYGREQLK